LNIELNKSVKSLLILEELGLLAGSMILFSLTTHFEWWIYAILFFIPDISFAAYLINTKIGSAVYNIFHHKGMMIAMIVTGYYTELEWILAVGIVFLGHAAFDRIFGYGLKFSDDFKHTHLGRIGE